MKKKRILALVLALALSLGQLGPVSLAAPEDQPAESQPREEETPETQAQEEAPAPAQASSVRRLAGKSRVETAIRASQEAYDQAQALVLAGFQGEVDALTGTRLAAEKEAPLLLTDRDQLAPALVQEIQRLGAKKAYILGGEASISAALVQELEALGLSTERLSGADRFATAAQLAGDQADHAFLALGRPVRAGDSLADALALGPISAREKSPVLLTDRDRLPAVTQEALKKLGVRKVTIVGGQGSVAQALEDQLAQAYEVDRLGGSNRQATSLVLARRYFKDPKHLVLVSGYQSADALVAGYFADRQAGPILLTRPQALDRELQAYFKDQAPQTIFVLGGTRAVSAPLVQELERILQGGDLAPLVLDSARLEPLIPAQFQDARQFSEGLAAVKKDGKWGYVNTQGQVVIDFQYDAAHSFREGRALVGNFRQPHGDWEEPKTYLDLGVIDQANHYQALRYGPDSFNFNRDLPLAAYKEHGSGLGKDYVFHRGYVYLEDYFIQAAFDRNGLSNHLIDPKKTDLNSPTTWVPGTRYFYINPRTGASLLKDGDYRTQVRPFNQGLAPIKSHDEAQGQDYWTLVNERGQEWGGPRFRGFLFLSQDYQLFDEQGTAILIDQAGRYGAVSKEGRTLIPYEYERLSPFFEGLAAFKKDGKFGYIDRQNQLVLGGDLDLALPFREGLALVQQGDQLAFINREGRVLAQDLPLAAAYYKGWSSPLDYVIIEEDGLLGFAQVKTSPARPRENQEVQLSDHVYRPRPLVDQAQAGPDSVQLPAAAPYRLVQAASYHFNIFQGQGHLPYLPGVQLQLLDAQGQVVDLGQAQVQVGSRALRLGVDYRVEDKEKLVLSQSLVRSLSLGSHKMQVSLGGQLVFSQDLEVRSPQRMSFITPTTTVLHKSADQEFVVLLSAYDSRGQLDQDVVFELSSVNIKIDGQGVQSRYPTDDSGGDFYVSRDLPFYQKVQEDKTSQEGPYKIGSSVINSGIGCLVLTKEQINKLSPGVHELEVLVRLGNNQDGFFDQMRGKVQFQVLD